MHNRSMIYGYARVSSNGQDLAQQLAQLDAAGCTKIYREKVSAATAERRSEEHTSELQSLMRISYAVLCLKKKKNNTYQINILMLLIIQRHTTHTKQQVRTAQSQTTDHVNYI